MKHQENDGKETKKTRKKRSARTAQQIKLAVIMIMVSVMILSASTFAWYQMSKTAKVENMQFTADTLGNLQISFYEDREYSSSINLELNKEGNKTVLLPATTADGKAFFEPDYDDEGLKIKGFLPLTDGENTNFSKHVYKKEFYIKSGTTKDDSKQYDLKLSESNSNFDAGTFISSTKNSSAEYTALRAVRVSFVFEEGDNFQTTVYEPYSKDKNANMTGTQATVLENANNDYGPEKYAGFTIKQSSDGKLGENPALYTITEGVPVKVTMYVWLEGNDDDCVNEIALDTVAGQIQFEATAKTSTP